MSKSEKTKTIEQLARICESLREKGRAIVHCHGVFDLLHIGHLRYFDQARAMGDVLIVTITPDCFVDKGPHRPAFSEALRAEAIASLSVVDYVAINEWPTAEETLRALRPNVYVKGAEFKSIESDMTGKIGREAAVVREIGARLAFTEDIVFSSTNLINRYLSNLPDEIQQYLDLFRQRVELNQVLKFVDDLASLKVLVMGDTIIDDYQYVDAIGKSSKDPVLVVQYRSHDKFAGGVLAVANHAAGFAGSVGLSTTLGEQDSHEDFIRERLLDNVTPHFEIQPGAPTLIKRRFIEGYTLNKLFEVYVMADGAPADGREERTLRWLDEHIAEYDAVIVADFGHGAVTPRIVELLAAKAPFLAVNTQANAGNRGFHTVTRYPRADFVCIAEHEIRLEMRDVSGDIQPMMHTLGDRMGCGHFVVTRGRRGCIVRTRDGAFVEVPSFALKTVDRVGAGDAFFSVTALAARAGSDAEIIGFLGNVAGAIAVEILGNQKFIDRLSVKKYITSFMK